MRPNSEFSTTRPELMSTPETWTDLLTSESSRFTLKYWNPNCRRR